MPQQQLKPIVLEDCRLIFRNFSGKETKFKPAGTRAFNVILDEDTAQAMLADGWNVKYLEPREEGDEPIPRIEVEVSYRNRPPRVVMLTSHGRTALDEDTVEMLDYAEIEQCDIVLNPYSWEVGGKSGIKAYLKTAFITIREDELERKYANVSEAGSPDED
jgi:hypothetical protein